MWRRGGIEVPRERGWRWEVREREGREREKPRETDRQMGEQRDKQTDRQRVAKREREREENDVGVNHKKHKQIPNCVHE